MTQAAHNVRLPLKPLERALPKGPVFGWSNFAPSGADLKAMPPSVQGLAHRTMTTSGRAAIYHALLQLQIRPQRQVLLPSYHCPTMVAPVLLAGATPRYFCLTSEGLPDLDRISPDTLSEVDAILVPHYFGLPKSLERVRAWCDQHGIALIEDCAHCLFGQAGERQVGAWGDFASASLSKFLPVPEAGLLASAMHTIRPLPLQSQGPKAQIKGLADVLDVASRHGRLTGLNTVISSVFRARQGMRQAELPAAAGLAPSPNDGPDFMVGSDMARINHAPLLTSRLLTALLPQRRIVQLRRKNYTHYARELSSAPGARALQRELDPNDAPYVFPLFVTESARADSVYHSLRLQGFPVFRWDRIWPGTPSMSGDVGPLWSRHVLQFLCHQDLLEDDVALTIAATLKALH